MNKRLGASKGRLRMAWFIRTINALTLERDYYKARIEGKEGFFPLRALRTKDRRLIKPLKTEYRIGCADCGATYWKDEVKYSGSECLELCTECGSDNLIIHKCDRIS